VAGLFVLGASATARADVFVFGDIFKLKRKTVTEDITVTKTVDLTVEETIQVDAAAEQEIVKNQRIQYNQIEDETATSANVIDETVGNSANGVVLINQAAGITNNQGNELSITYAANAQTPDGFGVFTHAQSAAQQSVGASYTRTIEVDDATGEVTVTVDLVEPTEEAPSFPGLPFANVYQNINPENSYSDSIGGEAFASANGVVGINQAAGALNNQNNALAIALGDDSRFALGEADLGQFIAFNAIRGNVQSRTDTINGNAFGFFSGIVTINQASGIGNNQINQIDIAASTGVSLPDLGPNPGAN
jgi:hypothetical protein